MNAALNHSDGPRKFRKKEWWASLLLGLLLGISPHLEGLHAPTFSAAPTCEQMNPKRAVDDSRRTADNASERCSRSVVLSTTHTPLDSASTVGPVEMPKVASTPRLSLGFASPASAAPGDSYVPDTAPWVNVNRHFGAAIRTGRIVPVTPNPNWLPGQTLKDGGVYMVAGDWPGWARSVDGGRRFESAVSGRVGSKNICGGYDAEWYGGTAVPSTKLFCSKSNQCNPGTSAVIGPTTGDGGGAGVCDYADNPKEMCTLQVKCSGPTDANCRYCSVTDKEWCMRCTGGQGDALVNREWSEAGPPSSLVAFHGATASSGRDVASGPAPAVLDGEAFQSMCKGPANQPGCAKSILYTANDWWSFFSPDAGRDWFRLTPQCEMSQIVGWGGFAADRGLVGTAGHMGGHLVGLAVGWTGTPGPREASGCVLPSEWVPRPKPENLNNEEYEERICAKRSVAWTDDVGPELAESMMATSGAADAWRGKSRTERAGGGGADLSQDDLVEGTDQPQTPDAKIAAWAKKAKWRYSSINHLAAPAAVGGSCKIFEGTIADKPAGVKATVPDLTCAAALDTRCHGRRAETKKLSTSPTAPADRDAWCPAYANAACKCTNGLPADCRYPNPTSVEIDPRNGWAYLSSDVGLLASPSGGRRWIRQGGAPLSNQADIFKKMTALDTFIDEPQVLGAKLYTKQYQCDLAIDPNCQADPTTGNSLDLNANSDRITFVGRMSLVFTACDAAAFYAPSEPGQPARRRGHVVASVPVEWWATPASGPKHTVSSVFVAMHEDDCNPNVTPPPPQALEFWDSAHLELKTTVQQHPDAADYSLRARTYFGADKPKLLRNLPLTSKGTRLRYTAAAVAASDPRVMWAFSYGLADGSDVAPTANAEGHLLWRSLDAGATWRIALPARGVWSANALRGGGGIQNSMFPELSIAPSNPHKAFLADSGRVAKGSGADEAWIVEPVPAAEVLAEGQGPVAACSACADKELCAASCRLHDAYDIQYGNTTGCDPTKVPADLCKQLQPMIITSVYQATLLCESAASSAGLVKCSYPKQGSVFLGVNNAATWCAAVPPAKESAFVGSLKPVDAALGQLYDTMGTCVGCGESGEPATGNTALPAPCCVRWRNASYVQAGEETCELAPVGTDMADHDKNPQTPQTAQEVKPVFSTRRLTTSRGASGSPDFGNAILPAKYSPFKSSSPVIPVAGDDGNSSVGAFTETPANSSPTGFAAGDLPISVLAIAVDKPKSQVWLLTSGDYAGGALAFAPQDTKAAAEGLAATSVPNAEANAYLRLQVLPSGQLLTPDVVKAAQASPPIILPGDPMFLLDAFEYKVPIPGTLQTELKWKKAYTTKSRLPGSGDIMDGWSIPRLKVIGKFVLAASPGIGVLAVNTATTQFAKYDAAYLAAVQPSLIETGVARFIKFNKQGQHGSKAIGAGTCAADIEVVGDTLFAVVADQAYVNSTGEQTCANVTPGLYSASLRGKDGAKCAANAPYCGGFDLIVPFTNPHSVELIPAAAGGAKRLVVADWSKAEGLGHVANDNNKGVLGGGVWSCDLATVANQSIPSRCRYVIQGDGITDIAALHFEHLQLALQDGIGTPWYQSATLKPYYSPSGLAFGARPKYLPGGVPNTISAYAQPTANTMASSAGVFSLDLDDPAIEANASDLSALASGAVDKTKPPECKISSSASAWSIHRCTVVSGEKYGIPTGAARAMENLTGISTSDVAADGIAQSSDGGQGTYWLPGPAEKSWSSGPNPDPQPPAEYPELPSQPSYSTCGISSPCPQELRTLRLILKGLCPDPADCLPPIPGSPWLPKGTDLVAGAGVFRLPLKLVRDDYTALRGFTSAIDHSIWWSSDTAGPPIAADPVANTTNRWTAAVTRSTTEPDALGWARVSMKLASAPTAQIHWNLNGKPLIGAWSPDHTLFWSATADLIEGPNDLQAVCPAETPDCQVEPPEVVFMRAPVEEALAVEVGTADNTPTDHAEFWFDTRSEVSLRQGVWAMVELADASTPTMLRWNSGPWLPVSNGTIVASAGNSSTSSAMFRIPVAAEALRHGSNLLELQVAPCTGTACFARAGILSARLVREASDDEDLCLASPEVCGNSLDDDCNGQTDDQGAELCDGNDVDGCANGHAACGSSECSGDAAQAPLSLTAAELSMAVQRIDAVYTDGSVVQQPFAGTSIHIGRLLTTGATVSGLTLQLPPTGNNQMVELVIRGTPGGARLPWPGYEAAGGREVEIRSTSADNGQELHLVFSDGPTTVTPGQPIVLLVETTPGAPSVHSVYGCNDGRLTFPSRLFTRNGCSFPGMDCAAPTGAGAACDVGPVGDPVWGDEDGCAEGHLFPVPGSSELVCLGDWPMPPIGGPSELRVSVTSVSYLWGSQSEPTAAEPMAAAQVLVRHALTSGTPLLSLELPVSPTGVPLVGIRLHLQAGGAAFQNASSPEGWQQTLVNSGPEDSGLELDLVLAEPVEFAVARPMAFVAASDLQPDWAATYACSPTETTVPRQILVRLAPPPVGP